MSELMAIESIAEEYAKFLGYFTETRVPFKLKKGHSDFDIIGFNPRTGASLVIECKAWGSPDQYNSFSNYDFKTEFKDIIEKWEYFKKSPTNKWKIKKLNEIWFVIPGYCDEKEKIENKLSKELDHCMRIMPIHKLILNIMFEVKKDKDVRRKRYSNPALEFCRWLLRGYEKGQINLSDIDTRLKGERKTYEILKTNYFKECLRNVQKNIEKRKAMVNTRINTLKVLMRRDKSTITELEQEAKRLGFKLNYQRINVGLGTWMDLGIVNQNDKNEYFIVDPFRDIVKKELR